MQTGIQGVVSLLQATNRHTGARHSTTSATGRPARAIGSDRKPSPTVIEVRQGGGSVGVREGNYYAHAAHPVGAGIGNLNQAGYAVPTPTATRIGV